jgi:hypothetical protein
MLEYYILKQVMPGAEIWVASLGPSDPIYKYPTEAEAEAAITELQPSYPTHKLKISAAA